MFLKHLIQCLKKKSITELDLIALDWGNYDQKLQVAAATNEEMDIVWLSDWMEVKYADFAYKGVIIPIDELLPLYAPKTLEFIDSKFWEYTKIDGNIYGVPCYQAFYRDYGMWFKKELVEKYNFDYQNAKSIADIEVFLKAVKNGEPELTPLAINEGYMWWFRDEFNPGGVDSRGRTKELGHGYSVFENDLTVAVNEIEDPEMRAYTEANVKAARDWYEKGYVRSDFLVINDLEAEVAAGKFACGFTTIDPGVDATFLDSNGFEIVHISTGTPELSGVTATILSIGATSKNPERAMMVIEILNSDKEMFNLLANGIEGLNYVKTGENRISRVENNGYQPDMEWALGNTYLNYLVPGKTDDYQDMVKQGNDDAVIPVMPNWNFNPDNVKNEVAAMDALWQEMGHPLWAGVIDPETELQKYFDKQVAAGKDVIGEEIQKQLDEYWVNN